MWKFNNTVELIPRPADKITNDIHTSIDYTYVKPGHIRVSQWGHGHNDASIRIDPEDVARANGSKVLCELIAQSVRLKHNWFDD